MNLSNHKFRFEAFQLPLDFNTKNSLIKETLEKISKIDKEKILHEYRNIKVYSNHQISNEENTSNYNHNSHRGNNAKNNLMKVKR